MIARQRITVGTDWKSDSVSGWSMCVYIFQKMIFSSDNDSKTYDTEPTRPEIILHFAKNSYHGNMNRFHLIAAFISIALLVFLDFLYEHMMGQYWYWIYEEPTPFLIWI